MCSFDQCQGCFRHLLEHLDLSGHEDFAPEQMCWDYYNPVEVGQFAVEMDGQGLVELFVIKIKLINPIKILYQ